MANEAADQLCTEITAVIDRFREESDLDFLDIIGALEINKMEVTLEMLGGDDEEEDEDDNEGEEWKPPNYNPL
jgi:sortase (surface protein transpeptidase)